MKTEWKKEWMLWLIIIAPLVMVALKWNQFADKIPTHWDMHGDVDQYNGKWALFLIPGVNLAMYFLLLVLPKLDPRAKNYDLFSGVYFTIRIAVTVLLTMVGFVICIASLGIVLDVAMIVQLSVLGLFLILGNSFGKIRPNYFVGLRTPWTLNNEEVWMRAHRFTGKLWVICSLLLIPCIFLLKTEVYAFIFFGMVVVMVAVPFVYSYSVHKQVVNKNKQ